MQMDIWTIVAINEERLKRAGIDHRQIHLAEPSMERMPGRLRRIATGLGTLIPARRVETAFRDTAVQDGNAAPLADRLRPREA